MIWICSGHVCVCYGNLVGMYVCVMDIYLSCMCVLWVFSGQVCVCYGYLVVRYVCVMDI